MQGEYAQNDTQGLTVRSATARTPMVTSVWESGGWPGVRAPESSKSGPQADVKQGQQGTGVREQDTPQVAAQSNGRQAPTLTLYAPARAPTSGSARPIAPFSLSRPAVGLGSSNPNQAARRPDGSGRSTSAARPYPVASPGTMYTQPQYTAYYQYQPSPSGYVQVVDHNYLHHSTGIYVYQPQVQVMQPHPHAARVLSQPAPTRVSQQPQPRQQQVTYPQQQQYTVVTHPHTARVFNPMQQSPQRTTSSAVVINSPVSQQLQDPTLYANGTGGLTLRRPPSVASSPLQQQQQQVVVIQQHQQQQPAQSASSPTQQDSGLVAAQASHEIHPGWRLQRPAAGSMSIKKEPVEGEDEGGGPDAGSGPVADSSTWGPGTSRAEARADVSAEEALTRSPRMRIRATIRREGNPDWKRQQAAKLLNFMAKHKVGDAPAAARPARQGANDGAGKVVVKQEEGAEWQELGGEKEQDEDEEMEEGHEEGVDGEGRSQSKGRRGRGSRGGAINGSTEAGAGGDRYQSSSAGGWRRGRGRGRTQLADGEDEDGDTDRSRRGLGRSRGDTNGDVDMSHSQPGNEEAQDGTGEESNRGIADQKQRTNRISLRGTRGRGRGPTTGRKRVRSLPGSTPPGSGRDRVASVSVSQSRSTSEASGEEDGSPAPGGEQKQGRGRGSRRGDRTLLGPGGRPVRNNRTPPPPMYSPDPIRRSRAKGRGGRRVRGDGKGRRSQGRDSPDEDKPNPGAVTTYAPLLARVKAQLARLRQEEHLVSTYNADGWKGRSRERVQLTKEVEAALASMQRRADAIRAAVRACDEVPGLKAISEDCFDRRGELSAEHIFCAVCNDDECDEDNDIILCDGECRRAFHCQCVDPPLGPEELDAEEWLCPACDCKESILAEINSDFGTDYRLDTPWQEVLARPPTPPGSPTAANRTLLSVPWLQGAPDRPSGVGAKGGESLGRGKRSTAGKGGSGSERGCGKGGVTMMDIEWPSDDEEDDDYGGGDEGEGSDEGEEVSGGENGGDEDGKGREDRTSGGSRQRRAYGLKRQQQRHKRTTGSDGEGGSQGEGSEEEENEDGSELDDSDCDSEDSEDSEEGEQPFGVVPEGQKRRRTVVNYVALAEQMFGPGRGGSGGGHAEESQPRQRTGAGSKGRGGRHAVAEGEESDEDYSPGHSDSD